MSRTFRRRLFSSLGIVALTSAGAIALSAPAANAEADGYTTGSDLSIRTGPGTNHEEIATIPKDVRVDVQCQKKGQSIRGTYNSDWWAKVSYEGKTGYVTRAFLRIPSPGNLGVCADDAPSPTPQPSDPVPSYEKVKARAHDWIDIGLLYNWDLYHPDRTGVKYRRDCSGFVSMVFELKTSATTVNLPDHGFKKIAFKELRPGDVVGNFGPGTAGANGHVVVFNGWADSSHKKFHTMEMHGPRMKGKAAERIRNVGEKWVQTAMRYTG